MNLRIVRTVYAEIFYSTPIHKQYKTSLSLVILHFKMQLIILQFHVLGYIGASFISLPALPGIYVV